MQDDDYEFKWCTMRTRYCGIIYAQFSQKSDVAMHGVAT